MQIFIDESGNFDTRDTKNVSVLGSLMFPENAEYKLTKFFKKLDKHISKKEKNENGELKGNLISDRNLDRVFEFISRHREFKISLKIFDCEINTHSALKEHREGQATLLEECLKRYMLGPVKSREVKETLETFINSARNDRKMSDQDYAQLTLMKDLIQTSIQKAFVYFIEKKYSKAFKEFYFICDNKSSWKYKDYLNTLITGFLETERSGRRHNGLVTINEMFFPEHPANRFSIDLDDGETAFDLSLIFENQITFEDSQKYLGLKLIDIIVSGVRGIILEKRNKKLFDYIRLNCAYFIEGWTAIDLSRLATSKESKCQRRKMYSFLQKAPKNASLRTFTAKF